MFPAASLAVTENVFAPAVLVSIRLPSATVPVQAAIRPPSMQRYAAVADSLTMNVRLTGALISTIGDFRSI